MRSMVGRYSKRLIMNYGVTANVEGDTLTLTDGEGNTKTFEVVSKGEKRKLDIRESGRTKFTYEFKNGVTVTIITGGSVHSITVTTKNESYSGSIDDEDNLNALIIALQKQTEKKPQGGKRKKTRKQVSRKKPAKLSRRRKFTHSK